MSARGSFDHEAFKAEIKLAGISVPELAEEIGLTGAGLYRYLSGATVPRIDDVAKWCLILRKDNPITAGRLMVKLCGLGMRPKGPRS